LSFGVGKDGSGVSCNASLVANKKFIGGL
jgi:hypothetical protein